MLKSHRITNKCNEISYKNKETTTETPNGTQTELGLRNSQRHQYDFQRQQIQSFFIPTILSNFVFTSL